MSRLRPVHQLTPAEANLQAAVIRPDPDRDHCGAEGARKLKERIEAYWRERGHGVELQLVKAGFHAALRSARVDVRSDMINGLPRPAPRPVMEAGDE